MGERHRIGIDLGGTKIEGVVLTLGGDGAFIELARRRVPTERERGYEFIVERTAALVEELAREARCELADASLGVGMPGSVARRTGLVKNSNTTCLNGRPFRDDLRARLRRPVTFDNDANCFALAETRLGAARAHGDGVVFGVIMGTGVGGGIVVDGHVWHGLSGIAGEWGHHAVYALPPGEEAGPLRRCYCGQRGCLEAYASGPAVEADYERRSGKKASLQAIVDARGGSPHARAAIEQLLDAFARGLANVLDVLDPSAVVVGGGVSNLALLYDEGVSRVASYLFNDELATPILRHALGDSAGVLGAALL